MLRTLPYEKRFVKFVRLLNRLRVQEIVRRSKSHRIPLAAILEWTHPVTALLYVLSRMMHYILYLPNEKEERRKQDIAGRATFPWLKRHTNERPNVPNDLPEIRFLRNVDKSLTVDEIRAALYKARVRTDDCFINRLCHRKISRTGRSLSESSYQIECELTS